MATWYTVADTSTLAAGTDLDTQVFNIRITPINPDTGIHGGSYIQASNFKVGGGEESNGSGAEATGTNIYENLASTWNADTGITKVEFTNLPADNSLVGELNNEVNARVTFGAAAESPTTDKSYYIDIDEVTTNPPPETETRPACFEVWLKYSTQVIYKFYQPSSNVDDWTEAANPYLGVTRTQLDDGTTSGWIKYRLEGDISGFVEGEDFNLIRVGTLRANSGIAIDTLPSVAAGPTEPDFSTYDFYFTNPIVDPTYVPPGMHFAFNHNTFSVTNSNNYAYIIGNTLSYNPLDHEFIEALEPQLCTLGNMFSISQTVFTPALPVAGGAPEITNVSFSFS